MVPTQPAFSANQPLSRTRPVTGPPETRRPAISPLSSSRVITTSLTRWPSPGTAKTGKCLSSQAMLLIRMSSMPKITVGRMIAYDNPDLKSSFSRIPFPRKYGRADSAAALTMLRCTNRRTPASAALMGVHMLATPLS